MNAKPEFVSKVLTTAVLELSSTKDLSEITAIVARAAREITGAEGTTFVLRDVDKCYYVDENAISPLWKGKKFPLEACISGWSMLNKQPVKIADIYQDSRIPHDAYRPTFVKSLCMIPIRPENPVGAIGSYWANEYTPTDEEVRILQVLANNTSIALENLELKRAIQYQTSENTGLKDRTNELEVAIHSVAHDLRSPLAAMTGLGELLKIRLMQSSDPKLQEYVEDLVETGHRAAGQIDRMLSLYRANEGKIYKTSVDVSECASEVVRGLKPLVKGRSIEFHVEPGIQAFADLSLIHVVLENLLSNAIKYSAKKSHARIEIGRAECENGNTIFFVKDNGAGFSSTEAEELFRPLNRLSTGTDFKGVGLGLASVARLVEIQGGNVKAEGKIGDGATFFVSLPPQSA